MLQKKKDRIDEYYVSIEEILTELHDDPGPSLEQLQAMEKELAGLLEELVGIFVDRPRICSTSLPPSARIRYENDFFFADVSLFMGRGHFCFIDP